MKLRDKARIAANDFRRWCKVQRLTAELEASADAATTDAFDPFVEAAIAPPGENIEKMKAYLSTCPAGATVADIMAATGIPEGSIRSSLNWSAGLFEQVDVTRAGKRLRKLWRVRRAVAA